MILRIKAISQIGTFRNFRGGGSVPFADENRITVIHAMNTYGKSTFTQILKSLSNNDPALVTSRKSIPFAPGTAQSVEISYRDTSSNEQNISFSNASWTTSPLKGHIMVFDQDFVNSHVMTGNTITRDNKVKFTNFILGSTGVNLSNAIEENNRQLRTLKAALKEHRPNYLPVNTSETDIEAFVNLQFSENETELITEQNALNARFKSLSESATLNELPQLETTSPDLWLPFEELAEKLLTLLQLNFQMISDDAWGILQRHLDALSGSNINFPWLKTGTSAIVGENCPYCSQSLEQVNDLVSTYRMIFNQEFEAYETNVKESIDNFKRIANQTLADSSSRKYQKFIDEAQKFTKYVPLLQEKLLEMQAQIVVLQGIEEAYKKELLVWYENCQGALREKESQPHKIIEFKVDNTEQKNVFSALKNQHQHIQQIQESICSAIQTSKDEVLELSSDEYSIRELELQSALQSVENKIARLAQDAQCGIYKEKSREINALKLEIEAQVDTLERDQSDFLETFSERLNYWFQRLGSSSGFSIRVDTNDRGDKKVYTLELNFHGQTISSDDLSKVFSESDRRNLALSVYLTKVENLGEDYILLLDDPVVSFDDNRRIETCKIVKELAPNFKQIILTTHYASLLKILYEQKAPATYLEIYSENNSSNFRVLEIRKFIQEVHQRQCEEILVFITGGKTINYTFLRVFMEDHLRQRFQMQLREAALIDANLNAVIEFIGNSGLIGPDSKVQLHGFRESLNPDNHRGGEVVNEVELRGQAKLLLELLYGPLSA